jgi:hypothetical protein
LARDLDPNNVVALLWLAWLAPSRRESLALFCRVLELDPDNKRARTGIEWVRNRLDYEEKSIIPTPGNNPIQGANPVSGANVVFAKALVDDGQLSRQEVISPPRQPGKLLSRLVPGEEIRRKGAGLRVVLYRVISALMTL